MTMRPTTTAERTRSRYEVNRDSVDGRRRYHMQILIAATLVVMLSLMLVVVDHQQIAFMGLERFPLPHSCVSRILWNVPCPACGLTRSFILLFHGDLAGSLRMHPLGFWIAALVVFQIPYRLLALRSPDRSLLSGRTGVVLTYGTVIALFVAWICRQFTA